MIFTFRDMPFPNSNTHEDVREDKHLRKPKIIVNHLIATEYVHQAQKERSWMETQNSGLCGHA